MESFKVKFMFYRPRTMALPEYGSAIIKMKAMKNKSEIRKNIRSHFKNWTGRGEITINWARPNIYPASWPEEKWWESLEGMKIKFDN